MQNDFNLSFLISFISFALLSILHRRTESLFKKYVKEDLTPFFKLNQLLNRACAQVYILYLYPDFVFILPQINYMITKTKKIQSVESNGEEA